MSSPRKSSPFFSLIFSRAASLSLPASTPPPLPFPLWLPVPRADLPLLLITSLPSSSSRPSPFLPCSRLVRCERHSRCDAAALPYLPLSPSLAPFFFQNFPGRSSSPALRRKVASWLLTTLRGIPQVAEACVISWLEKPFRLECERPVTPPPRSQDFQHRECSQPSPNAGPSVLWVSYLGLAPC